MVSTQDKIRLSIIFLTVILFLFLGCGNSKTTLANQKELTLGEHPKMAFLNYQVSKTPEGSISIQLINKIMADGLVKEQPNTNQSHDNDWECYQLNDSKKVLQRTFIANPFLYQAEYINDNNEFETKTIELNRAQISLRLQLHKDTKFVTLRSSEKTKTGKPIEITTILD